MANTPDLRSTMKPTHPSLVTNTLGRRGVALRHMWRRGPDLAWPLYLLGAGGALAILSLLSAFPLLAVFLANLLLCVAITLLFPEIRKRWLLLLYPLLVLAIACSITQNWFDAGDGPAHTPAAEEVFQQGYWGAAQSVSNELGTTSITRLAKHMSPGASLGYQIPFHFFGLPAQMAYQDAFILSQGFVYLCLVGLIAVLIRHWNLVEPRFAFAFIAFLVLSPTALSGHSTPNRHLLTMAVVCLLLITHMAVLKVVSPQRLVLHGLSVALVLLSKPPLLIPYAAFSVLFFGNTKVKVRFIALGILLTIILSYFDFWDYLSLLSDNYAETRVMEMRLLGQGMMDIPVVGWSIKYIYAILSPFPWYRMDVFVNTILSGSYLLFLMNVASTLTGLYFLSILLLRGRRLLRRCGEDSALRSFVVYGLVMSTTILYGATGFHVYLAIFFPLLAPMVVYKDLRVSVGIPVSIAVVANIVAWVVDAA